MAEVDGKPGFSGVEEQSPIVAIQLGVWRVLTHADSKLSEKKWTDLVAPIRVLHPIRRLVTEIYCLSPAIFTGIVLAKFFGAIRSSVLLYQSSQILNIVSQ
jgi:hypothetical protein